jgi:hypothetical protein
LLESAKESEKKSYQVIVIRNYELEPGYANYLLLHYSLQVHFKILANSVRKCLPHVISLNQSAFVKDRRIGENIMLAQEILWGYHKQSIYPRCTLKIDLMKAFDSIKWNFLLNVMEAKGFPSKFIKWLQACLESGFF